MCSNIVETHDIIVTMGYLLGQKLDVFNTYYSDCTDLVEQLKANDNANKIRHLCKLRIALFKNFRRTNDERIQLKTIEAMEWFDNDDIKGLRKLGIETVLANKMAKDYAIIFNELIDKNIDACKDLFPEWLNFSYIRDLFVIPKYTDINNISKEMNKYIQNKYKYPHQLYIHWDIVEAGNILMYDEKFLRVVYQQHGEEFTDTAKVHDAGEYTKKNIYDFINEANKVIICVDCENCDPYKLYGTLSNLDSMQISKIDRIVLYDDEHTTRAWDYISSTTHIDVEHIEVNRVVNGKSLVDIRLTAGVCKAHYEENVDSFILCSSDSDFWGLIQTLDKAKFLVMYEYEKCGRAIKEILDSKQIFHCSLDDFYTGNAQKLKTIVLKKELEAKLPDILGRDAWNITKEIYQRARIQIPESEMKVFYDKYIKTLRLKIDASGAFVIEMTDN